MISNLSLIVLCSLLIYTSDAFSTNKTQTVVYFPKQAQERIISVIKTLCANETEVPALLKLVKEGKYREDDEFKNFVHCTYKNTGYANENGRVNIELAASVYPDPVAMLKVMKQCDEERGPTSVETTFRFFKCFQNNSPFLIGFESYKN